MSVWASVTVTVLAFGVEDLQHESRLGHFSCGNNPTFTL